MEIWKYNHRVDYDIVCVYLTIISDAKSPGFTGSLPVWNLTSRWTNKISRYSRRTDRALRHKFRESKKM